MAYNAQAGAVGNDVVGEPGSSMRGVTGRESIFSADVGDDKDVSPMFDLPVDSEHKAKKIKIFSLKQPHMRAFHLSWFHFFIAFCSAFAVPPLNPIIRDNLNLTKTDLGNSGIAAISGAIAARVAIGPLCDMVGPRYAASFLLMGVVPAVCAMATVRDAAGYLITRFFIGLGLASFVTCQYWMSSMFNARIVGLANGVTAGWGNLGGGFIQLVMPVFFAIIRDSCNSPKFTAWRIAFFIPALAHIITGLVLLTFGQDCPDGQYLSMVRSGQRKMDKASKVVLNAFTNYRAWIMALTYGYCFGVELTADNILAEYFHDRFNMDVGKAGSIASSFGLMNIFSRPSGGIISDLVARRFGMRGRLWALWMFQTLGGVFCITMGFMDTLSSSIAVMIVFSFFVEAACGMTFGIIPFISRRSLGIVSGMTGAGGNLGSAVTQASFFTKNPWTTETGLKYMGIMIVGVCQLLWLMHFPQWGGMLFPASKKSNATEEGYYGGEYNEDEKAKGLHVSSMKFAENAKGERGAKGTLNAEEADARKPTEV
eukprot:jgi/Mesen1/827/ME000111S10972